MPLAVLFSKMLPRMDFLNHMAEVIRSRDFLEHSTELHDSLDAPAILNEANVRLIQIVLALKDLPDYPTGRKKELLFVLEATFCESFYFHMIVKHYPKIVRPRCSLPPEKILKIMFSSTKITWNAPSNEKSALAA